MDLDGLRKSGRFAFVDGLTGLHTTPPTEAAAPRSTSNADGIITSSSGTGNDQFNAIRTQIDAAVSRLSCAKKVLLVDGLDAYVAMTQPGSVSAAEALLMSVREVCLLSPYFLKSFPSLRLSIYFYSDL